MGRLLILLSLLFAAANAFAAVPGNAPTVCIGAPGQQTQSVCVPLSSLSGTGVNGIFSLYMGYGTTVNGNYYPLTKNGLSYQVPSGKTAYCFNLTGMGSSASQYFQVMSATASFAANAATVTGAAYQCGAAANSCNVVSTTAYAVTPMPGIFSFSSLTYPGIQSQNGVLFQFHMDCFEQ